MSVRILHTIDTTGPGGAETVFLNLVSETVQAGWLPIVVIRGPGWVEDQLKSLNVQYYVIDCKGSFNLRYLLKLLNVIKRHKISVIQSHLLGSNIYSSIAGGIARVPVVSTFHGHVDISESERYRWFKFFCISLGSYRVVCVTEALASMLKNISNTRLISKISVIPNGIELADLLRLDKSESRGESFRIACLGNVRKAKNYKLAVKFVQELIELGYNVTLDIAGDCSNKETEELKHYVKDVGLSDRIKFLGFIKDIVGFLKEHDIFLMTSTSEGHPLALTQALAAGLPVLSTRSGIEEVVDERHIYLSDEHTASSLVMAFKKYLEEDALVLKSKVCANRSVAEEKYSLEAMTSNYMTLYRERV